MSGMSALSGSTQVPAGEQVIALTTHMKKSRCAALLTRPGFHGPCHEGHMACVRAIKRREADGRNGLLPPGAQY
jgi:hypothetical protein